MDLYSIAKIILDELRYSMDIVRSIVIAGDRGNANSDFVAQFIVDVPEVVQDSLIFLPVYCHS